jgi:uncharacterized protein (TIGR03435 family)
MRTVALAISLLMLPPAAGIAQNSPASSPAFEVATIKPSNPDACCARGWGHNGKYFNTGNTTLKYLIQWSYGLQARQVAGGPPWLDRNRFDAAGEIEGMAEPNDRQWKLAVRQLLKDRFQLQFHHDTREMPAYALVVAKGGSKLAKGDSDPNHVERMGFIGAVGQTMHGVGVNATIADFIGELQRIVLDRPIVDRTGLSGAFNIQLVFTREAPEALGMSQLSDTAAPNLLTALQQQLGLKLEPTRAPVDVLVIDHAEMPSEN